MKSSLMKYCSRCISISRNSRFGIYPIVIARGDEDLVYSPGKQNSIRLKRICLKQ